MTSWLKLPLRPAILAALAPFAVVACTDAATGPGYIPLGDDGGGAADATSPAQNDSGSPGTTNDSGGATPDAGKGGGDSGGACSLPPTWSQCTACDACQTKNCCAVIQACANDTACTAIYTCQAACYSGTGPDGGPISSSDAAVDDAGDTAQDVCANNCLAAGSAAAQGLFASQDTCVNTTFCATSCLCP